MKSNRKERTQQLANDLQKSSLYEVNAMRDLVDLLFEDAKDLLVSASGDELLRLQGEARALERLYSKLTRPVVGAQQEQ